MQTTLKPICFVAGQSAGHILPALTLATKETHPIIFIATNKQLDQEILKNIDLEAKYFLNVTSKLFKSFIIFMAILKTIKIFWKNKPVKIVTTSGLIAVPVCIAGKLMGIPFEIFELNVVPGKSTKFLAPLASKIFTCFKVSQKCLPTKKCHLADYPVRFTNKDKQLNKIEICNKLGLLPNKKIILILGGSQGSIFLNKLIANTAKDLTKDLAQFQIIHQTGTLDKFNYSAHYKQLSITAQVVDYCNNIEEFLTACDIIICRSGAGTLAEVLFFEKKCITIPLETNTTTHQIDNAKAIATEHPELVKFILQSQLEDNPAAFKKALCNFMTYK